MRIAFAGDWHGNFRYTQKALSYAAEGGADVVIQVGDFGVWSPYNYVRAVGEEAALLGLQVFFVDGNHEDHPWLNAQPTRLCDGFRVLHDNVAHIPRGTIWEWDGTTFLGLGGAHSVDRQWRTPSVDWFPEETLTYGQLFEASQALNIDVMVTHDCPAGVEIPGIAGNPFGFPKEEIALADKHREMLGYVVDNVKPGVLVHGHYHVNYSDMRGETSIIGLDCDGRPLADNIFFMDT